MHQRNFNQNPERAELKRTRAFYYTSIQIFSLMATLTIFFFAFSLFPQNVSAYGPWDNPAPVDIGSAADFIAIGKTAITGDNLTTFGGNIGVSPTGAAGLTLVTCANMTAGRMHTITAPATPVGCITTPGTVAADNAKLSAANVDSGAAYLDAINQATHPYDETAAAINITAAGVKGRGIYNYTGATSMATGLILRGSSTDIWIFQINGAKTQAAQAKMVLQNEAGEVDGANGPLAKNIIWAINGAPSQGAGTRFVGTVISTGAISVGAGSTYVGRAFSDGTVSAATSDFSNDPEQLAQTHYHWRNDDGDETDTGATSATGGSEDTAVADVALESSNRLRLQVSNKGGMTSTSTAYVLEYGAKAASCELVSSWINVGETGGAFDMSLSSHISDGNTTDIDNTANGAMTEENITLVGTGALRELTATSGPITLLSNQYTELEYSIETNIEAGYATDYCFRATSSGDPLPVYDNYAELTTRERKDFFIQRGTETVSGTSVTLTAGVDYIAPSATSSAFVRITNTHLTGAGNSAGTNGQEADDVTAYISDQSDITSSFIISRPSTAISNTRVSWEIVEFIGLPGTDNEMIVRGVGEVSLTSTEFTDSGAVITDVSDNSDVVVFITGQQNQDQSTTNYNDGLFTAEWDDVANQPTFERDDADSSADLGYAVVEFTGLNWSTQRIEHTYTSSGVAEAESMSAIGSISRAFTHTQKRVGEGLLNIDEGGHLVFISSVGAVTFELRDTADTPSGHVSVAWVIENTQTGVGEMTTYQSSGEFIDADPEPATYNVPIGGTVKTFNASIFGNNTADDTGTTYPRLHTGFAIVSSTAYEVFRSDTASDMEYRVEVVEWPTAETSIRQNYYRFYVDNDVIDPTDPWPVGASDLGENTSITETDDPLGEGQQFRLRMTLRVNNATLPESTTAFKLQYGLRATTCSAISAWTDIGAPGSGTIWRGYDGTVADGTEVATGIPAEGTLNISVSDVAGTYEEQNNSEINPYSIDVGEDVEYDWHVERNGAINLSNYCFRMVESDGALLDGYNNYPTLRTAGYTPTLNLWRFFDDETNITPVSALAATNTAPIDIANDNIFKLRTTIQESKGVIGTNIKIKLQFSEFSDFSESVFDVVSSSTCATNASSTSYLWCYADAAGIDNAQIDESVLSDAGSCTGGSGDGCGTHNEGTSSTTATFDHPGYAISEYEFTLEHAGARANAVYYFRLYDVTNATSVPASSTYPSVVTEGAALTFTVEGLSSGTLTEGTTTDVTTTPTGVPFGSVPLDTSYKAAQTITVDTNATQGYQVLLFTRQTLLNTYAETIPAVTGTNASPVGWYSGCLSSATGCFGYHAGDDTLNGSTRFAADDSYAAFDTTPQEIMYSSVPANESSDIVYGVQVTGMQPAGDYETEIVYMAIPVF
ncbi:MAG: hypothetical protein ACI9VM_000133 [Candidatus Azotimanducaceae bacterium]|jgi:hypothetical protein